MNIPLNKNMDEYKDDVFKGLNGNQLFFGALTVVFGVAGFAFADFICRVPQTLAFYVAVVFALPPAIIGFLKIRGMTIPEYLRKRRQVLDAPLFIYKTMRYGGLPGEERKKPSRKVKKGQEKMQIYFDEMKEDCYM